MLQTSSGGDDVFLIKYDSVGNYIWGRQFGTSYHDSGTGLIIGKDGFLYLLGYTFGSLYGKKVGDRDVFVAKLNSSNGATIWGRQFGSKLEDYGYGIGVDSKNNIYLTGFTAGALFQSNASYDAFLVKYSSKGIQVWGQQFDWSNYDDYAQGLAVSSKDEIYITGSMQNLNYYNDLIIAKFDVSGNELKFFQYETEDNVDNIRGWGISVDSSDNVYISGDTTGSTWNTNQGINDAFVVKFKPN